MTHLQFIPPDDGGWAFDRSHQQHPLPRLVHRTYVRGRDAGFAVGFESIGSLLENIEAAIINGWVFGRPRPVGAPPGGGKAPPWPVLWLLTRLHPAIRRRNRTAATVFERRPWLEEAALWEERDAAAWEQRLAAHQTTDLSNLDDPALFRRVDELLQTFEELIELHFRQVPHVLTATGVLVATVEDLGLPASLAFRALVGNSPETSSPKRQLRAIRQRVDAAGLSLDGDPQKVLATLRAHDAVGPVLNAYLDEYGGRVAHSDLILGETLAEQPSVIVASIRGARLTPDADTSGGEALLDAVPAEHRDEVAKWLADAYRLGALREHVGSLMLWNTGLLRTTILELGSRLVEQQRIPEPLALYHLEPEELAVLPPHDELVRRAEEFASWAAAEVPQALGEVGAPPSIDILPKSQHRLTRAVSAIVDRFDPDPDLDETVPLHGLGVSPGVVEGRAHQLSKGLEGLGVGDILIAHQTTPALNSVLPSVGGLVTEYGGLVSHAAIVARELGFPGIVGCHEAVRRIPHGALIRVDADAGRVEILAEQAPHTEPVTLDSGAEVEATVPDGPGSWSPLPQAVDAGAFGGKAAQLARATAAGQPVPRGFALDTVLVQGIAAGGQAHLDVLAEALASLDGPVAVRSSAPDEDGHTASFAGLHLTELGVRGVEQVACAVEQVWRSGHGSAAVAYRRRMGLGPPPGMAVVIQEMIEAQAAGVRFGRDPVTGDDVRVIEGAVGLGVSVVDGRVRPDRVRLAPDGSTLETIDGDKPFQVVMGDQGVHEVALEPDIARANTLDPDTVAAVHQLGEACDALFDGPQDVEWARTGEQIWLLQSRPVTTGASHAP